MKFRIAALAILVATGAFAQDAAPVHGPMTETSTSSPAPVLQQPQKFYLELDPADLQSLSLAIMELPKKVADPLILKINAQLQPPVQAQIAKSKADREAVSEPKRGKK